jgi:Fe-S-cluster-containing hydrogenase component 2
MVKHGVCDPQLSRIQVYASFLDINLTAHPCLQCVEPLCMEACPADAIVVDEMTGARVVDDNECIACGECVEACGECFDPPRLRLDPATDLALKCDLCGGDPECAEACPTGALSYVFDGAGIRSGHPVEEGRND